MSSLFADSKRTRTMTTTTSRRELLTVAAGLAATTAVGSQVFAQEGQRAFVPAPIPELAPQWKKLNLAEILKRPAAFASISQNNSLYRPWVPRQQSGSGNEATLEATVK